MNTRFFILCAASVWAMDASAQSIEVNGRQFKLQPKPKEAYWQEPRDALRNLPGEGLPTLVDLTEWQTPIKDQANRGSCAYFTTVALFEQAIKKHEPDHRDVNLSEEYLIYANKALDRINTKEDASYLAGNIRTFTQRGFVLEELVPYTHSWFQRGMPCADFKDDETAPAFCRSHYEPSAEALQAVVKRNAFEFKVDQLGSIQDVMQRLAEGYAVTISVPVNQMGWASDDGRVEHNQELEDQCKKEPDLCGGHTVLLTGYNQDEQVFYFKNSWGASWGNKGYGLMPFDFVKNWSYGSFYSARVKKLNVALQNAADANELSPVVSEVKAAVDNQGRSGVMVSLQFTYKAPLGSFYYVSLFPQLKWQANPSVENSQPSYKPVYATLADGSQKIVSDFRYILARSFSDLSYSADEALTLFVSDEDLEKAGVKNAANLVLRPSIYRMTDAESYKILFREYLSLPEPQS